MYSGWGPASNFILKEFEGIPFGQFFKNEKIGNLDMIKNKSKIGKFCDITTHDTSSTYHSYYQRGRIAKERKEDSKEDFSVVESKLVLKTNKKFARKKIFHPPQ